MNKLTINVPGSVRAQEAAGNFLTAFKGLNEDSKSKVRRVVRASQFQYAELVEGLVEKVLKENGVSSGEQGGGITDMLIGHGSDRKIRREVALVISLARTFYDIADGEGLEAAPVLKKLTEY